MAIVKRAPNTILLSGGSHGAEGAGTHINDWVASEEIKPGMLIEPHDEEGTTKWRKNSSATNIHGMYVALEQLMLNLGVDDVYADGDLVQAFALRQGSVFWALVPSGQDISREESLQSNGDGKLKAATSEAAGDNVARFKSLDDLGAVNADTRVRAEVLY
jgi:hypothetical protein